MTVRIRIGDNEGLEDADYDRINSLLTWLHNDIYLIPILDLGGEDRARILSAYDTFVKRMLEAKDSWIDGNVMIGMTVPAMVSKSRITHLFDL